MAKETKEKMYHRNYTSDDPIMYRDIYTTICEAFDELQTSPEGVSYSNMIKYIMQKSKGHWNPNIVFECLTKFEK